MQVSFFLLNFDVITTREAEMNLHILHVLGVGIQVSTILQFDSFMDFKGGESSSQFQWFTIAKIEL